MQEKYHPHTIESAAQKYWDEHASFRAVKVDRQAKYYCLSMFPYPSGKLHMGHVRNYTIGDVLARYHRMRGRNVLQPMGWDAFGLPAENAAIANKVPPAKWTSENIAYMKSQLQSLGFGLDWEREFATCEPAYYKWNQWLFLRMLERGIAYKKTQTVNWDPIDQTVLANEQVIDGHGWRTGAPVEKKEVPGYYLGITQYAEELLADLGQLSGWPERVKTMQANWIGKSHGVRFAFSYNLDGKTEKLWVYTTRADTIMGVTFISVAAEHPLAIHAAKNNPGLHLFIEECKRGSVMEADLATNQKKGMPTGIYVTHPLSDEKMEVWIGNYVLMGYGEGAVMGVPAHDERDFYFAKEYGLPIKQVIDIDGRAFSTDVWQEWYADKERGVCIHSGKYDGMRFMQAVDAVAADLKDKKLGEKKTMWRLRDWGISRQRYWGTPIPIIHCERCGEVPVPDDQLPVILPEDCVPDGSGNPLAKRADFLNVSCPKCREPGRRETDTMDTFVDSSWYYARYASQRSSTAMVDDETDYWMPVDQYIGGIEHAILHLLYSRFWSKVMRDCGLVKFDEPFANLLTQGMVLNHVFLRKNEQGGITYFAPEDVAVTRDGQGRIEKIRALGDGSVVEYGGMGTMSKSKHNGVNPQQLIDEYGADTARLFIIFASSPDQTLEWSDSGVEGAYRFLKRLWAFLYEHRIILKQRSQQRCAGDTVYAYSASELGLAADGMKVRREYHEHLKQIDHDFQKFHFNTVVSGAMKIFNVLYNSAVQRASAVGHGAELDTARQMSDSPFLHEGISILLRILSPITPHITHYLWRELGYGDDILCAPWPEADEIALISDEIELVVQVNGKLRGNIRVSRNADRKAIERTALAEVNVQKHIGTALIKKIVVVPGRLVNVVV